MRMILLTQANGTQVALRACDVIAADVASPGDTVTRLRYMKFIEDASAMMMSIVEVAESVADVVRQMNEVPPGM